MEWVHGEFRLKIYTRFFCSVLFWVEGFISVRSSSGMMNVLEWTCWLLRIGERKKKIEKSWESTASIPVYLQIVIYDHQNLLYNDDEAGAEIWNRVQNDFLLMRVKYTKSFA